MSGNANNQQLSKFFPGKLYLMLDRVESLGLAHGASWVSEGRAFAIHNPDVFMNEITPQFFDKQTHLRSFHRQLSIWGFTRLETGSAGRGVWFHKFFVKNQPDLIKHIKRVPVKNPKASSNTSNKPKNHLPDYTQYKIPPTCAGPDSVALQASLLAAGNLPVINPNLRATAVHIPPPPPNQEASLEYLLSLRRMQQQAGLVVPGMPMPGLPGVPAVPGNVGSLNQGGLNQPNLSQQELLQKQMLLAQAAAAGGVAPVVSLPTQLTTQFSQGNSAAGAPTNGDLSQMAQQLLAGTKPAEPNAAQAAPTQATVQGAPAGGTAVVGNGNIPDQQLLQMLLLQRQQAQAAQQAALLSSNPGMNNQDYLAAMTQQQGQNMQLQRDLFLFQQQQQQQANAGVAAAPNATADTPTKVQVTDQLTNEDLISELAKRQQRNSLGGGEGGGKPTI